MRHPWLAGWLCLLPFAVAAGAASAPPAAPPASAVAGLVARDDAAGLRALGPRILPELARLYGRGDVAERARIANLFYQLSWKSPEAAAVLLRDVRTQDVGLRIAVQYALGRVSDQPAVVEALLHNMTDDPNPVIRDKAACALSYDQIFLSEPEKVKLYEGLVQALDSPEPQVRSISILALRIHTGQTKGFLPTAPPEKRRAAVARWQSWLAEYKANL